MKKFISFALFLVMLISICTPSAFTTAYADDTIYVYINNEQIFFDQPPIIVNERTMVPIRAISEAFDAEVTWDGDTRAIGITLDDVNIMLAIDNTTAMVNGKTLNLDQPPLIVNGRTLVPIRFVSEAFGAEVEWNDMMRAAFIYLDQRPYYAQKMKSALAGRFEEDIEVTEELILLFMKYYDTFSHEMDFMPDFEFSGAIPWEDLALYVYLNTMQTDTNDEDSYIISRQRFDDTVNRLFGGLDYEHQSTGALNLTENGYMPTGWGLHFTSYFRLRELSVDAKGIYTATFDELVVEDWDAMSFYDRDASVGGNIAELISRAGDRDIRLHDVIAELFVMPEYTEVIDVYRTFEVVFFIAESDDSAFTYLSSKALEFY